MWVRRWKQESTFPENLINALKVCDETAFPNIRVLLQLALMFPITSCESERSFSQLKLIKTSHRSTMTEDRLSALSLMKINQARLEKLHTSSNMGHLVKRFYQLHPRRMKLEFMLSDGLKTLTVSHILLCTCLMLRHLLEAIIEAITSSSK